MALSDPVPSTAADVFKRNVEDADRFINSTSPTLTTRKNYVKKTLSGMEAELDAAIAAGGYVPVSGSFEAGGTVSARNEVLLYEADGYYYKWAGTLPKVVSAVSTPATAGGVGAGFWTAVGGIDTGFFATLTGTLSAAQATIATDKVGGDPLGAALPADQKVYLRQNAKWSISGGALTAYVSGDYELTIVGTAVGGETFSVEQNSADAEASYTDSFAPTFLKTTSDILNQEPVNILRITPKTEWISIKGGTSNHDIGADINSLITDMNTAGGGRVICPMGGKVVTSQTIALLRGIRLGSDGYFNVRNRSVRQYGLFSIHAQSEMAGSLISFSSNHEGTMICGIALICDDQASGSGLSINGSGTATPNRNNGVAKQLYIQNAKDYGLSVNQGVGGLRLQDIYSYGANNDNIRSATDVDDCVLERVFGSDSVTANGLNWSGDSTRIYTSDFWENTLSGALIQGGNNDLYRMQCDLNGRNGLRMLNASNKKRNKFVSLTTLDNSKGSPGVYSEIELASTIQTATFIGGTIGAYPGVGGAPSNAKYGIEYLGSSDRGISFIGVSFPSEVFTKGISNGLAARWCKFKNCFDAGDTNTGRDLSIYPLNQQLVPNPDLQNSAAGWTVDGSVTVTNNAATTVNLSTTLRAGSADTTQNVDIQLAADSTYYLGRKVILSGLYKNLTSNTYVKNIILRIGTATRIIHVVAETDDWERFVEDYTLVAADTGALVLRIQVKASGQGSHTESFDVAGFQCIIT